MTVDEIANQRIVGLRWFGSRPSAGSAHGPVVLGNLLAFTLSVPWAFPVEHVRPLDVALVLFLGTFQIGLAYAFVVRGMRRASALVASILLLIEPALNPVWAWLVHGETPGTAALVGGALVLVATGGMSVMNAIR